MQYWSQIDGQSTVDSKYRAYAQPRSMVRKITSTGVVLRRQQHRRSGLANLPSVGAIP